MEFMQSVPGIITLLWDPIARRVNYFAKIGKNIDDLQNQVKELTASRDDIKREVERAEGAWRLPKNEVQGWLNKADEIIENAQEMKEELKLNKKSFYRWCLDCRSRYELGKRVVKATQDVRDHMKKNSFDEIAVPPLAESVQGLPTTTIRDGTSTMGTLDQVWNWLTDAETGKIGIWGKGGVGKTTLVMNIHNRIRGTQHFEVVIFVTVSRDWNIKKLRNDIGKEIYLDLSAEEDETRASRLLFNKLKGKRFLLILDDMWDKIDLDKLGVPKPEEDDGCKIVITTRKKGVCHGMETDEEIMVKVLSRKEAWELFQEKAANVISSNLEPIARDVCKECHGLPLAIIVVGRALRKETDTVVWENALRLLQSSQFELQGLEHEVYLSLKFSYDHLKTEALRKCFLYCSLFPEDYGILIDELIEYWIMEGFIEGVESLTDATAKGQYLLKELIDSCLLEKDSKRRVKMHDVIRDMAIKITSESTERGRRFLVRAGLGLQECPEVGKWEGKDRISLMENNIQSLPDEPKCTELSTLLLQGNRILQEIQQSFFKQMKNLRVLDLSCSNIVSLPPSISELGNLQALILRDCYSLISVTHVGGLKQLQLLDLSFTFISKLPHEIGQLTRLRRLNLSYTFDLAYIPADMILSLSLLEDLEMMRSSYFRRSNEKEAVTEKLGQLKRLIHFSADIPNELCTSGQWESLLRDKLKSFNLRIGRRDALRRPLLGEPRRRCRCLDITRNANVSQEAVGLLQYAETLRLYCHHEVRTISAMGARNLKRLKECRISRCNKMESVVIMEAEEGILPKLEILHLSDLPNLRSIWEGNGAPGSFRSIKEIFLYRCDNVRHLFSTNELQLLISLEELKINSCVQMVEIVAGEVGNGVIALPKLRRIVLKELPELNRMWEGFLSLESLREMEVLWCTSLTQLAINMEKTSALEVIRGDREWWDSLEWQNDSSKSHFQNNFKTMETPTLVF
ncbi:putative Disease resistance protein [Cocos nucifera]|nr:putative Disease resistance protein [Cocos nucifera]